MISISILTLVLLKAQADDSPELQLLLRRPLNATVIRVGDKVALNAGFRNNSRAPLWLDGRIAYKVHLQLRITDEHGSDISFPGSMEKIKLPPPDKDDFVRLASYTELLRSDLTNGALVFAHPGKYTLTLSGSHGSSVASAKRFGINLARIGAPARLEVTVLNSTKG